VDASSVLTRDCWSQESSREYSRAMCCEIMLTMNSEYEGVETV